MDAQGLHLSEAPALTSFPRTPGAQGRGREEQPGEGRTENQREGELEQKRLGPELGVSGIAPTSRTLSNLLPTGQNSQVYFYSRRNRAVGLRPWLGGRALARPAHQGLGWTAAPHKPGGVVKRIRNSSPSLATEQA